MTQTLTIEQMIRFSIQEELREIIEFERAPYLKFVLMVTAIEFLGACMDDFGFTTKGHSQDRFDTALSKLFRKGYHKYAKKGASIYLYEVLRCGMVHKLSPKDPTVLLTTNNPVVQEHKHMDLVEGSLVLVLEDFYTDLVEASEKLIKRFEKKKITNKKFVAPFLDVRAPYSGDTQTMKWKDASGAH